MFHWSKIILLWLPEFIGSFFLFQVNYLSICTITNQRISLLSILNATRWSAVFLSVLRMVNRDLAKIILFTIASRVCLLIIHPLFVFHWKIVHRKAHLKNNWMWRKWWYVRSTKRNEHIGYSTAASYHNLWTSILYILGISRKYTCYVNHFIETRVKCKLARQNERHFINHIITYGIEVSSHR
jgi:hypothetical protein